MAARFTDGRVPSPGIGALFGRPHRWQRWLDVEAALAAAEADLGVIPAEAGVAIGAAATLERIDVTRVEQGIAATSHPLMALVTELSEAVGEPHGGWVHWGATTQNITQTGDVLVLREAHRILLGLLARVLVRLQVILAGLELDEGRMRANLDLTGGLINSEAVMLALGRNVGRQTAHKIVYAAARAAGPGLSFAQALQRDPRVTAHLDAAALQAMLDPATHRGLSADLARTAADRAAELAAELARAAGPG